MVDISFLLPTARPHKLYAIHVINSIINMNWKDLTYEIVYISKEDPLDPRIVFVKEPSEVKGCVEAYNIGFDNSVGDYIILCSDDHVFDPNTPKIISILETYTRDRKYKIICLPTNNHGPCALPEYTESNAHIARYPVFKRSTIISYLNGKVYHPSFIHHYPDNWLGYWLDAEGEPVIEHDDLYIRTFYNACIKEHDTKDEDTFKKLLENYKKGYTTYV